MIRNNLETYLVPIGAGVGHIILVLRLLTWFGYPLTLFAETAIHKFSVLLIGLFLVVFIPLFLFIRARLVVPLGMSIVGFGITMSAGLTTPHPEFVAFGENILVVGSFYVSAYANGWYIWLLAYVLGGVGEYVVRMTKDGLPNPRLFRDWHVPLDRQWSVFIGCVIGFAHMAVISTLGVGHEGMFLSGWLLGWGLLGMIILGAIPTLFLLSYKLILPLIGLVIVILIVGVDTLTMTVGTPVSSYLLLWPIYFVLALLLATSEYSLRWGRRKVTIFTKSV